MTAEARPSPAPSRQRRWKLVAATWEPRSYEVAALHLDIEVHQVMIAARG